MHAKTINEHLKNVSETVSLNYPAIGWYFSPELIEDSICFNKERWVCMFMFLKMVLNKEKRVCFSKDHGEACLGAIEYFGYARTEGRDGSFIANEERFKKNDELARLYYSEIMASIHPPKEPYLYMERLDTIDDDRDIEVVTLFPDIPGMVDLHLLSHYDRESCTDNILAPFASGCQSVFTIPYNEGFKEKPRSVIGLMDPCARDYIPKDMISFSVPANRFAEMAENIQGSFLDKHFRETAHP